MKPLTNYEPSLLDNDDQFTDAFFKRFELRHAPAPLQLDVSVSKNYRFPTFYGDVTCAIGIFLCSYARAKELLPDPRMKPVSIPGGRAVVTISCYEYRNVMNVPPYNEIAFTIPTLVDAPVSVPILPLLWGGYPGFGYYVFHMPVTSLENRIRGNKIWGLPKVTEEIDIRSEGDDCVTTAFDQTGTPYFTLRVPKGGQKAEFDVSAWLFSKLDGKLIRGRTNFKAPFAVNKNMPLLWGKSKLPEKNYIELSDVGMGATLKRLEMDSRPFQFRYAEGLNACFDLPDPAF